MSKLQAIHFDMDGVIADTEPFHVQAEIQTCIDHGFDIDPNDWDGFKGKTAQAVFEHLVEQFGNYKTPSVDYLVNYKTDVFLTITKSKITPIEGVLEFLDWARKNHVKMTLVTSSNKRTQKHIIDSFGIEHYFDHIITGDDIKNGKPHPEPYLKASKLSKVRGSKSIVIEDSKSGIESALKADCLVLAIATSHSQEELKEASPTLIAVDYVDARRQIENLLVS